jgi:hypothetical protein
MIYLALTEGTYLIGSIAPEPGQQWHDLPGRMEGTCLIGSSVQEPGQQKHDLPGIDGRNRPDRLQEPGTRATET